MSYAWWQYKGKQIALCRATYNHKPSKKVEYTTYENYIARELQSAYEKGQEDMRASFRELLGAKKEED